uniref:Dolichyl-diphosphooligosaccharide--protein glycosyltransferase 48 kDa subunit n=1 Tax=Phaeomonas parva TaxID=124430 RepID=A0A7S1TQA8_9STRA|mmetsp:Transcript_11916/g.36125  ORF Transcript_11916/g.36125 Transcript_11916/m.36125 type:complete len:459 (+) Transcript_11916:107-1483(+)|eukprot:CAMPEP_0118877726 /NCGR_PEP_ID=MMETSP1163-20130328/17920_1 /TAXON_ID=124430 /ORGANISM="Phaeomonas parva, Strain CCMP2877" /LENGTH=458 /DNA_ID=CAMNT_0006813475 /DNA_START=103 /DNA_END=1479 /DNA_ORIENTATION=-
MRAVLAAAALWASLARAQEGPRSATSLTQQGVPGGKRTLVLLQEAQTQATHSNFFRGLADRGHELSFALASDKELSLYEHGERLFDNLCLFAPNAAAFGAQSADDVLGFLRDGGNVLLTGDVTTSDPVRRLAAEVGIDLDESDSQVIDHASYDYELSAVVSRGATPLKHVLGEAAGPGTEVRFRGIGHAVSEDNYLAVPILVGNPTTFSAAPGAAIEDYPENIGADTLLVSGVQGHNNARLAFCGSLALFSDAFGYAGNEAFANGLGKWAFNEAGVLQYSNVTHSRVDGSPPELLLKQKDKPDLPYSLFPDPEITRNSLVYRIKDTLRYEVTIREWDAEAGDWRPFDADDVQLEFVMLDPFIRTTLESDGRGTFSTSFMAPDTYGIFKFKLLYRRPGYSTLHVEKVVSVRPFKHNEYDRYITSAYPYYTTAFVMMAAVAAFSYMFLFTEDKVVLLKQD